MSDVAKLQEMVAKLTAENEALKAQKAEDQGVLENKPAEAKPAKPKKKKAKK